LAAARARVAIAPFGDKRLVRSRMILKANAALELAIRLYGLAEAGILRVCLFHGFSKANKFAIETPNVSPVDWTAYSQSTA